MAVGMVYEFWNRASLEESGAGSGCTLWRSVLSDAQQIQKALAAVPVLMHLMVLGAF